MAEYLWQNIDRHAPGGCWQWRGSLNSAGYARTSMRGTIGLAHRAMYELIVEPIPDGLVIDHLCRNRGCVNPSHLEVVTMAENTRRGERHGPIGAAPTINQKTGNIGVG